MKKWRWFTDCYAPYFSSNEGDVLYEEEMAAYVTALEASQQGVQRTAYSGCICKRDIQDQITFIKDDCPIHGSR